MVTRVEKLLIGDCQFQLRINFEVSVCIFFLFYVDCILDVDITFYIECGHYVLLGDSGLLHWVG